MRREGAERLRDESDRQKVTRRRRGVRRSEPEGVVLIRQQRVRGFWSLHRPRRLLSGRGVRSPDTRTHTRSDTGQFRPRCPHWLLAAYLQGSYKAPRPDSTEASTYKRLKHSRSKRQSVPGHVGRCGWSYLSVDQRVVEQDEPVDGEPAGVLQGQSFVAALADQPAVRLPERVLETQRHRVTSHDHTRPRDRHAAHTLCKYRHFAGEALPEMEGVLGVLPLPLQPEDRRLDLGAAVLQPLVVAGGLTTRRHQP